MGRIRNKIFPAILVAALLASLAYNVSAPQPAPKNVCLVVKPKKSFEEAYDAYSIEQKTAINAAAQNAIGNAGNDLEKAAALTYYVHNTIMRGTDPANNGFDILKNGNGVCGGMSILLAELLYSQNIPSSLAYLRGGGVAHSMVEAELKNGEHMLLDPYFGVVYYDTKRNKPVGIVELMEYINRQQKPVLYVKNAPATPFSSMKQSFAQEDPSSSGDYHFPALFTDADGYGLADSGFTDTIIMPLTPGTSLGNPNWKESTSEPRPWTKLSTLQLDGRYLSWAYMLGDTYTGYHIQHSYALTNLVPNTSYTLEVEVANAYTSPFGKEREPAISIQQIYPTTIPQTKATHHFMLEQRGYAGDKPYHPQTLSVTFTAQKQETSFIADGVGDFVISAITLKEKE